MTGPEFDRITSVERADVYKSGRPAGTLTRESGGGISFAYLAAYLESGAPAVASSLPLRAEPVLTRGGSVPNFFAGLLPEGQRLVNLQRAVKTSLSDEFSLLLAVGADTPGDVQLVPHGEPLLEPRARVEESDWERLDFGRLAEQLDLHALPGVQNKVSGNMRTAPLASDRGSYLVKFGSSEYPLLLENEHAHLIAARALKIPVARSRIIMDRHGAPALLVRRFDRMRNANGWVRLAQEDAAQAADIPPADKYRIAGEDACTALMNLTEAPLVAARNLYLQLLFAWLTGNGDLHAKNIAVIADPGLGAVIAPIYDVPCTLVYGDRTIALSVDGKQRGLRRTHWDRFGEALGLPERAARSLQRRALPAAMGVDLSAVGFEGSPLRGAERELRFRRDELG